MTFTLQNVGFESYAVGTFIRLKLYTKSEKKPCTLYKTFIKHENRKMISRDWEIDF